MYRLPVSGIEVSLRGPAGADDLLLYEAARCDTRLALALIARLASPAADWSSLCITDFEALLLLLRRTVLGDLVQAETACPTPGCRARVDVSFRVGAYLAYRRPRTPKSVEAGEGEWFRCAGEDLRFRLPAAADVVAAGSAPDPEAELLRRCVEPVTLSQRERYRVERAMQALAPTLSQSVKGACPHCGSVIEAYFSVQAFVLRELRNRALSILRDIHLLAGRYNWREEEILALPASRRMQYAAMIAEGGHY
jgi:hypothetical protein